MKVGVVVTEDKNLSESRDAGARLKKIIRRNRSSEAVGVYAVCSAHPQVIVAAAREAHENGSVLHVESTSSQVNQFGGYTGQNPEQFANFVRAQARDAGLSANRVLLGGDHLGPFPWRREPASVAMDKARALVRTCVLAGYQKIHLDASMACADDPKPGLDERTIADRAAALCKPDAPKKQQILDARDHLLAQNPKLRVVGAHLGSMEDDLDGLAQRLDRYPNFAVDTAARAIHLVVMPSDKVRAFILKYQDRVVYGTDLEFSKDESSQDAIKEWEDQYARDWRYFSTRDAFEYDGHKTQGLGLPPAVLRKLYHANAAHWFPGILTPHQSATSSHTP